MGRKKIQITRIQDERNRQITFSKRKAGLLKKAYELSILCDVEIAMIMITGGNKLYQYASSNMNSILIRYTEFKDPDESKTNADVLDDINRRDKDNKVKDGLSGDEDDDPAHLSFTPNTHAHYQRIDEEFDQVLHQENPSSIIHQLPSHAQQSLAPPTQTLPPQQHLQPPPPQTIVFAASTSNTNVPQAMPVSVPVTSPDLRLKPIPQTLGSAGSSRPASASTLSSPDTPLSNTSSKGMLKSPPSAGSMPPPAGTPTRLQTIRNQTLKLHLPGGGRNYVSLPSSSSGTTPPKGASDTGNKTTQEKSSESNNDHSNRPQLKVVIPGQKGFIPKTGTNSPPVIDIETPPSNEKQQTPPTIKPSVTTAITTAKNDSLTTPIMSLTTPSIFSSTVPPALSGMPSEFPLSSLISGEGGSSTSALVAFPISIQPGAGGTPGNNLIIQAQNMGQPFLLTPTPSDKQGGASLMPASSGTGGGGTYPPATMKDLEQLKLQYDKIYQQISETLQHQEIKQDNGNSTNEDNDKGVVSEGGSGSKRGQDVDTPPEEEPPLKRPHVDNT